MGVQGWEQFVAQKQDLLNDFEIAKIRARGKPVQVDHGIVAEAIFRTWLLGFLPKKYGVTSGYIISQGLTDRTELRHFDVIIYDQLNAPVLWTENNPDKSVQGRVQAIPAEHVLMVLEVKASLNSKTATDAIKKLQELRPLLSKYDAPTERYPRYLPPNFSCGTIFFELGTENHLGKKILKSLLPSPQLRGYFGGVVLSRPDNPANEVCGEIMLLITNASLGAGDGDVNLIKGGLIEGFQAETGEFFSLLMSWSVIGFSSFAFGLIKRLGGTYDPRFVPSFHGLGFPIKPQMDEPKDEGEGDAPNKK